jgi:hypothetical protein
MWPAARLSAQVSFVPHLLSRAGVAGTNSRRGEIELVRKALPVSIADFQLEVRNGDRQLAIENGVVDD